MPHQENDDLSKEIQASFNASSENTPPHIEPDISQQQIGSVFPAGIIVPPKQRSKAKIAIAILTALLLLGTGVYIAYQQFFAPKPVVKVVSATADASPKPAAELTPELLISKLKQGLSGSTTDERVGVFYKVPSTRIWVTSSEKTKLVGFKLVSEDQAKATLDMEKVKETLKSNGIAHVLKNDAAEDFLYYRAHYASEKNICSVSTDTESSFGDSSSGNDKYTKFMMYVGCATIQDMSSIVKEYEPFIKAYDKAEKSESDIAFLSLDIKDAKVAGYKTAGISIFGPVALTGGAIAMFYKAPDTNWKYFTGVQSVLGCESYNTNDLKNAYAGDTCYNGDTPSVVRAGNL